MNSRIGPRVPDFGPKALVAAKALCAVAAAIVVLACPTPSRASSDQPIAVIFVEGLNSQSRDNGGVFDHVWADISGRAPDAKRLQYSYSGGIIDGAGEWRPSPYSACDTHQPLASSAARLGEAILAAHTTWPERKVAVVGHSLGGVVALSWAAQAALTDMPDSYLPQVVITVDSPLRGITQESADSTPTMCSSAVLPELVSHFTAGPAGLTLGAAAANGRGSAVLMVGNRTDIAFACCGPNIWDSQFLDSAAGKSQVYLGIEPDLPGLWVDQLLTSHLAALFNREAVRTMGRFVVADD